MKIDMDYIQKLADDGRHYELMIYVVPLLQQIDDWAEQNRLAYAWSRLWKQAAKKEKAKADRRLELLREIEEWVAVCPICLIRLKDHPFEIHKKADEHSDTCELARELGDDNNDS